MEMNLLQNELCLPVLWRRPGEVLPIRGEGVPTLPSRPPLPQHCPGPPNPGAVRGVPRVKQKAPLAIPSSCVWGEGVPLFCPDLCARGGRRRKSTPSLFLLPKKKGVGLGQGTFQPL